MASIGENAFQACSSLTSIIVSPANSTYDSRNNCNAIIESSSNTLIAGCKSTVIPDNVTTIGEKAFNGSSGLTSIAIPESVTSIQKDAFFGCSSLTSVTVPNSVKEIGRSAFESCTSLTSVSIGSGVTSIGERAFYGCSGLTKADFASIESLCRISFATIESNPLSSAHHLYIGGQEVTDLVIPDNEVKSIGNYTFYGCSDLTSVTIGNWVKSIGEKAFTGCSGLTSVTLHSDAIASSGSSMCNIFGSQVKEYILDEYVKGIGNNAFEGCSELASVTLSNWMESIGERAFYGCSSLTSIIIPFYVTSIENYTFYGCSSLASVTIASRVKTIGEKAFEGCHSLTSVTLSSTALISSGISLSTIFGSQVKEYILDDGMTRVGDNAFEGCSCITSIIIPYHATSIGENAFSGCSSLTSVVIPFGVRSIGEKAFSGCSSLTSVTCWIAEPPTMGDDVFYEVPQSSATLYVEKSSVNDYKAADQWKAFGNVVGLDPTGVEELKAPNTLEAKASKNAPIYDLNGRRLSKKPTRGYYIQGGKKYRVQ